MNDASGAAVAPETRAETESGASAGHMLTSAEMGALAHLYRAEIYRSTIWRTRLDTTTNWAVVLTGIALSITFGSAAATPLPLLLIGPMVWVFLVFEARRYRYFNMWRARCRLMEREFYVSVLEGERGVLDGEWNTLLADDYRNPGFHISMLRAIGRRLRKNYCWVFMIQIFAYFGKLAVHPVPMTSFADLTARAALGPASGTTVILAGAAFHGFWGLLALYTWRLEVAARADQRHIIQMGAQFKRRE